MLCNFFFNVTDAILLQIMWAVEFAPCLQTFNCCFLSTVNIKWFLCFFNLEVIHSVWLCLNLTKFHFLVNITLTQLIIHKFRFLNTHRLDAWFVCKITYFLEWNKSSSKIDVKLRKKVLKFYILKIHTILLCSFAHKIDYQMFKSVRQFRIHNPVRYPPNYCPNCQHCPNPCQQTGLPKHSRGDSGFQRISFQIPLSVSISPHLPMQRGKVRVSVKRTSFISEMPICEPAPLPATDLAFVCKFQNSSAESPSVVLSPARLHLYHAVFSCCCHLTGFSKEKKKSPKGRQQLLLPEWNCTNPKWNFHAWFSAGR